MSSGGPPHGAAMDYYNDSHYQGQQQQQQQPPPQEHEYGSYAPPQFSGDEKKDFNQVFALEGPKYHDIWAGLLFLACFAGFVAISGITIHAYAKTKSLIGNGIYDGDTTFGLNTNSLICLLICVAVAVVLSVLYVCAARVFTKALIWITGILNIGLGLATAIYMLYRHYYSGGIVFLVFVAINIFCFISWIPRIPWTVLMLQTSIGVSRRYGHVYIASFMGGLAAAAFGVWYSVTMVAVYVKYEPDSNNTACSSSGGSCSKAKVIGIMAFITFAGYWITEWLKNTIHTTIAGVYGSWYFAGDNVNNYPRGTTRSSLRRATTYSFGSISLGSLVVAIINFMRQLCSMAQQHAAQEGNIVSSILYCLLGCFIWILDWAVQFVNRYAFCHIALYGSSYFRAAKDTWRMIKSRGIDALVSQCLIGPVFSMGAIFVAYATALTAYVFLRITDPAYNKNGGYTPVLVAFAFLIGMQICNVFTVPLSSGIDTIFVAMAWDPQVLMQRHPELYSQMVHVYPQVQQAIHD